MSDVRLTSAGGASWQEVASDRKRHRDATTVAAFPDLPSLRKEDLPSDVTSTPATILSAQDLEITRCNTEDLVPRLASGQWSATIVVQAFLRRAALAQKLANCVTELLAEKAMQRAKELDEHMSNHKTPVGPLHGLPISVKEHIGMKGLDLNAGFVGWVGRIAEEDALALRILWDAGAVFYVRTTQPQTLMHLETSSNLYGETTNPFNSTLTAGGSSGGEGSIVGLRGSVLGIGSDIGGSIRSPAANNGVFGFKPTCARLPVTGWSATMAGTEAILATIGPLSTSLAGVKLFTKTVLDGQPWRQAPELVAMNWREDMATVDKVFAGRKLKVAVMWDDGVVKPHPPLTRGLTSVVDKLRQSDKIEVVEWKPYQHDAAWSIISNLYFCDGGREEKAAMEASGEPLRPLSKWILDENPHVQHHDVASLWASCTKRDEYRHAYAKLWNETGKGADGQPVDVILCPAGPGVAPKLNTAKYWGYTSQWNLLDYPAAVFPTQLHVNVRDDGGAWNHEPRGESDRYNWGLWAEEHGAEGYEGAPISLQLVARRYEDEKLLAALELLLREAGLPTTTTA